MNFNNSASSSNIENNLSGFERGSGNSIDNAASVAAKGESIVTGKQIGRAHV